MIGTIRSEGPSVALGGASPVSRSTPSSERGSETSRRPSISLRSRALDGHFGLSGVAFSVDRRSSIPSRTLIVPPVDRGLPERRLRAGDARTLARIFKGRPTRSGRFDTEKRSFDASVLPPRKAIPGPSDVVRKKRKLFPGGRPASPRSLAPPPKPRIRTSEF